MNGTAMLESDGERDKALEPPSRPKGSSLLVPIVAASTQGLSVPNPWRRG